MNTGAWTLMHRYNKASDLLADAAQVGGAAGRGRRARGESPSRQIRP